MQRVGAGRILRISRLIVLAIRLESDDLCGGSGRSIRAGTAGPHLAARDDADRESAASRSRPSILADYLPS